MLDQTNLTGVINDSFDESRDGEASMSGITEIFAKLKMQIEGHADEKYNIPLMVRTKLSQILSIGHPINL
jgi:hypothetical protein